MLEAVEAAILHGVVRALQAEAPQASLVLLRDGLLAAAPLTEQSVRTAFAQTVDCMQLFHMQLHWQPPEAAQGPALVPRQPTVLFPQRLRT